LLAGGLLQASATARASVTLTAELVRIGLGRSDVAPERGVSRFRDPTWTDNPHFHRLMQCYLAWCRTLDMVVDSMEVNDWRRAAKFRFLVGIATSASAPTNFVLTNPAAVKHTLDTGGVSLLVGLRNWASDLVTNRGI